MKALAEWLRKFLRFLFPPPSVRRETNVLYRLPHVHKALMGYTPVTQEQIERLRQVKGQNAWIGYPEGFDFPTVRKDAGTIRIQTVPGNWNSGLIEVFRSDKRPGQYLILVYVRPEDLDYGGNPPGTHPSGGAWLVNEKDWKEALD